ncbi:MAG TPA: DedA family protein [Thermoleophilaceae bacterium]
MPAGLPLASLTNTLTDWIGNHGVYAVFTIMAVDALLPLGGELTMLYAGVLASGAIAGQAAVLFGAHLSSGIESYIVLALAGSLGYLAGSLIGWVIGNRGGRPFVERHGRWLHLPPDRFGRAERWFDSHESLAVFLGRLTPLVRSFISIPAGVFGTPIARYVGLTLAASLIWCFAFAGAGWALGGSWESFHHDFKYADYAAVLAVVALAVGAWAVQRRQGAEARNL